MHTRDSQGRQVSLLNDDPPPLMAYGPGPYSQSAHPYDSGSSLSGSEAPFLVRSNSYDSDGSGEALSPMTPGVYDYGRPPMVPPTNGYPGMALGDRVYDDRPATEPQQGHVASSRPKRSTGSDSNRAASYDEDSSANSSSIPERQGKRYPCRYRDTHGCDKTFTTSGHASRHSKIHTAEKAVPCTYPNCHKKFTRADNMKQHLETHYKDKSRSCSSRSSTSRSTALTSTSGSRRASGSSARASGSSGYHHHNHHHRSSHDGVDTAKWGGSQYGAPHTHAQNVQSIPSPVSGATWDLAPLNLPLVGGQRIPNSGLDALAMAVACQEGGAS